jgi:uncharacterized protein YdeI (YjbR/CyaY-like superfamily)
MPQAKVNPKATFFKTATDFRAWLAKHYSSETELWVCYFKKDSGLPSITYPESLDQALCFGWIDGVRRNLDEVSYAIRFTPRKPRSIWSAVNTRNANALTEAGLMHESGAKRSPRAPMTAQKSIRSKGSASRNSTRHTRAS